MRIFIYLTILVNLISVLFFITGLVYNFQTPEKKASFGYYLLSSMYLFLIFLFLLIFAEIFIMHNYNILPFVICLISPYIIGYFAKYNTYKFYTIVQIIIFLINLHFLITLIL